MIAAVVVAVALLVDALLRAGLGETLLLAPWVVLLVWGVYVLLFASHVSVDREGATVQNLLRRTRLPWTLVSDITFRWQVVFTLTDGRVVKALGGPAGGRRTWSASRDETRVPAAQRDLELIREPWIERGDERAEPGRATYSWDILGLVVGGVLALTLPVVVLIAYG